MTLDVAAVRAAYPALADGYAYLDGAAGTQVPAPVIDAISAAYRPGSATPAAPSRPAPRSDSVTARVPGGRSPTWSAATPDGVILGPNMTTLTYRLAGHSGAGLGPGDEVVVSRLDHDANVRPWVQAAAAGRGDRPLGRGRAARPASCRPGSTTRCCRRPDPAGRGHRRPATSLGTRPDVAGDHRAAHGPWAR